MYRCVIICVCAEQLYSCMIICACAEQLYNCLIICACAEQLYSCLIICACAAQLYNCLQSYHAVVRIILPGMAAQQLGEDDSCGCEHKVSSPLGRHLGQTDNLARKIGGLLYILSIGLSLTQIRGSGQLGGTYLFFIGITHFGEGLSAASNYRYCRYYLNIPQNT